MKDIFYFTTINHLGRTSLGLSMTEYCIADAIYHLQNSKNSFNRGWCNVRPDFFKEFLDISRATLFRSLKKLEEAELIEGSVEQSGYYRTTDHWFVSCVMSKSQNETTSLKVKQDSLKMKQKQSQNETPSIISIKNKDYKISNGTSHKKYSSVSDIKEEDLIDIAKKYNVSLGFVKLQFEKMKNWLSSSGKRRKDYKATLRNFVLRDVQQNIERKANNEKRGVDARNL